MERFGVKPKNKTFGNRVDTVVLRIGHHNTNAPQQKQTVTSAERKDITRKHAVRNSTATEQ